MKRPQSFATRFLSAVAERLADDPAIPQENRQAFRNTALVVMEQHLREIYGGDTLRLYLPKEWQRSRAERDRQITAALCNGEAQKSIARRFHVSLRHVERLSSRLTRQLSP